jgi:hypothetical protein
MVPIPSMERQVEERTTLFLPWRDGSGSAWIAALLMGEEATRRRKPARVARAPWVSASSRVDPCGGQVRVDAEWTARFLPWRDGSGSAWIAAPLVGEKAPRRRKEAGEGSGA